MLKLIHIPQLLAIWFCTLFLITMSSPADAQRYFDQDKIESYKKNSAYNYYKRKQEQPEETAKKQEIGHSNIDFSLGNSLVNVVLIVIFIALLVFLAYVFAQGGFKQTFVPNKPVKTDAQIEQLLNEDQIDSNDFDSLIKAAGRNNNYRLVLRLMFLKALQNLHEKQQIKYAKTKTNYEYSYEIRNTSIKTNFDEVSEIFSWVWYGNSQIDEASFQAFEPKFKTFISDIEAI